MKRYLAYDYDEGEHETFDTIEEAREYLIECFLVDGEGYVEDPENYAIFELFENVKINVIDNKENYKYEDEEDIPENDKDSEAWPYSNDHDEIWNHEFVSYKKSIIE